MTDMSMLLFDGFLREQPLRMYTQLEFYLSVYGFLLMALMMMSTYFGLAFFSCFREYGTGAFLDLLGVVHRIVAQHWGFLLQ